MLKETIVQDHWLKVLSVCLVCVALFSAPAYSEEDAAKAEADYVFNLMEVFFGEYFPPAPPVATQVAQNGMYYRRYDNNSTLTIQSGNVWWSKLGENQQFFRSVADAKQYFLESSPEEPDANLGNGSTVKQTSVDQPRFKIDPGQYSFKQSTGVDPKYLQEEPPKKSRVSDILSKYGNGGFKQTPVDPKDLQEEPPKKSRLSDIEIKIEQTGKKPYDTYCRNGRSPCYQVSKGSVYSLTPGKSTQKVGMTEKFLKDRNNGYVYVGKR